MDIGSRAILEMVPMDWLESEPRSESIEKPNQYHSQPQVQAKVRSWVVRVSGPGRVRRQIQGWSRSATGLEQGQNRNINQTKSSLG